MGRISIPAGHVTALKAREQFNVTTDELNALVRVAQAHHTRTPRGQLRSVMPAQVDPWARRFHALRAAGMTDREAIRTVDHAAEQRHRR